MNEFEDGASEEKEDRTLLGRHHELSSKIQELEMLAEDFRGKVGELTQQFEGLQEDIEELVLQCEGNQQDYWMALAALKEEKATVDKYAGFLANTEIENTLLRRCVPKEDQDAASAFSQARPGSY
jgi:predicted  nucleic acid-binding Zn-ribbon protein